VAINPAYPLEMGNIKLNDNLADLDNIVASKSGASGDNTIALAIANLRDNRVIADVSGMVSLDDYYQTIILIVGTGGSEAKKTAENQRTLVNSAEAQRQSIMGVSMDEEMSNMMRYKFAYSASSRAINVIDICSVPSIIAARDLNALAVKTKTNAFINTSRKTKVATVLQKP